MHNDPPLPGYGAFTAWCRRTGLVSGPPPPRPTPGSRPRRAGSCSSTGRRTSGWSTRTARSSSSTCSRRRWATPAGTSSSPPREDDRPPARVPAPDVQGPRRRARGTRHRQHVGARLPLGRQEAQGRAGVEVRRRGRVPPGPVRAPEPRDQGQGRERQQVPLQAGGLRGRVRRLGGPARVRRPIEARSNEEPNATTGLPPAALFMREKESLRPVGNMALLESMVGDVSVQVVPRPCSSAPRAGSGRSPGAA